MKNHYASRNRTFQIVFTVLLFFIPLTGKSQNQDIKPSIEPAIFTANTEITVTYDVTGNTLANLANAWIWVWIPGKNTNAKYNVNPASGNAALTDNAKLTKTVADGKTTFSITFTPANFFDGDISQEKQLGMLLKGNDWANGQTTDFVATLSEENTFSALLVKPELIPVFLNTGENLIIEAIASEDADYSLVINGVATDEQNETIPYNYEHTVTETEGIVACALTVAGIASQEDTTITFNYIIRTSTIEMPRPAGIISGINYHENDDTKVTLCLLAPMKSSVFVLGEFNDFTISPNFQMSKDGEYFWLEVDGLTPGQEYAFQYLVDESVYVADPYADKILDPDDKWIPASIYPNLKTYPQEALRNKWYFNRLSVIQTAQTPFTWINNNYSRPEKDNLIIYELLIRDFFDENNRNYERLIDTLGYFKKLGINAIELMPVHEFNGNQSWGYNPTFMFAADKAYGTKEKLKAFIDAAHENGIAVILDVVFNHQDIPNPYAAMYFDFTDGVFKPTSDNPWFNVDATHPFSVFFDMDHESEYTKYFMDTTLHYWINEYKIDGFRFDLSKGFTQTVSGSNVGQWGQKDQSRIDLLTRMADKVWSYAPDTWLMLEHFANNDEETILADYGFMLWGNMHGAYKETILGFHENNKSNLEWGYAPQRGWQDLNLITYMESHDEERQMVEATLYGNTSGSYNIKQTATALDRVKAASTFLYLMPGPKMFWQFGELGYDVSINENGRTGEKPVLWSYYNNADRKKLHDVFAELIRFRLKYPIFTEGEFLWAPQGEVKRITMGDEFMKLVTIGNFGVNPRVISGNFPEPGMWFDFFTGNSFEVSNTGMEMLFAPGEFHIYTTKKIEDVKPNLVPWGSNFVITSLGDDLNQKLKVYPNPVHSTIQIQGVPEGAYLMRVTDLSGRNMMEIPIIFNNSFESNFDNLPGGLYQLSLSGESKTYSFKIVKN
jgi:1,4-alpha-glucan branching enzyme